MHDYRRMIFFWLSLQPYCLLSLSGLPALADFFFFSKKLHLFWWHSEAPARGRVQGVRVGAPRRRALGARGPWATCQMCPPWPGVAWCSGSPCTKTKNFIFAPKSPPNTPRFLHLTLKDYMEEFFLFLSFPNPPLSVSLSKFFSHSLS